MYQQIENASRKHDAARLWRARLRGLSKELADQCSRALARRRRLRKATRSLVCVGVHMRLEGDVREEKRRDFEEFTRKHREVSSIFW